ncbi:MAG: GNAT family N-acetyltransferase [Gemmatimonadota bacterium]|nr:GNAT family N-acetyltransferase [Gemmatimonadota bacterium]MDE2679487.1 GNAT family N-acetyltransferase [Gemmatimonadota bacterium]MXX36211.1 GNAT family N-acetyltransferase [Gemmatimonadota bacterium]MYD14665.1 GNAT family N-acetyltransferase [Gemmatimonadota bacterium]
MSPLTIIDHADDLASLPAGPVEPLEPAAFHLTTPSRHLALQDRAGRLIARCSLWRARDHHGAPTTTGLIGHYAAADADAGNELLEHATTWHRADGCDRLIGPMDGSTWHRYRLLTERGTEPAFFLEPDNPDDWPGHFASAGFVPLATYFSALNADLTRCDPRSDQRRAELERDGITVRKIDIDRFEAELAAIHELSLVAFAGNLLYSPIRLEAFLASYAPIRPHLVPDLVLLAERGGQLVGFIFAIPDLMEPARGGPQRTAVVKSMAVHPTCAGKGLGGLLMDDCQQAARKLGFERAIHALMHETNRSRGISARYGKTIRRYTLYGKALT